MTLASDNFINLLPTDWASIGKKHGSARCFGFSYRMKTMFLSPHHSLSYPELLLFARSCLALLLYLEKRTARRRMRERAQMISPMKGRSCKLKGSPEGKCFVGSESYAAVVSEHSSDQSSGIRL